jgi:phage/plasmid-associated DNA primase
MSDGLQPDDPIVQLQEVRRERRAQAKRVTFTSPAVEQLEFGSDVEIASRVVDDLEREFGKLVFCEGDIWRFDQTHWKPIDQSTAYAAVQRYDGAQYLTAAGKASRVLLGNARIQSVLTIASMALDQPEFFASAALGINCVSGFIAFAADGTPQLVAPDRAHRCRHMLLGSWRPGSDGETLPADSLLERLLGGVFKGDSDAAEKRKVIAEVAGATALGYATKLRRPKAIILQGEHAENGKSQILDILRALLPATAVCSISADRFGDERFIVRLRNKFLDAADELSGAAIASEAFKAIVTGNPISGRDVYKSAVDFRPVALLAFAVNQLPTFTRGMDRGVRRRVFVLIFNRVIPADERVEDIGLQIGEQEPDLLLGLAVSGASRLVQQREFTNPPSSHAALINWIYRSDPVAAWAAARVDPDLETDPRYKRKYKSSIAHQDFREWAIQNGYRADTLPAVNGFVQRLLAEVTEARTKHTKSGNWIKGIVIRFDDKSDPEDDQD